MRQLRALLPFALASVAVVAVSSLAVVGSLGTGHPGPSASSRVAPPGRGELSPLGRAAYWRADRAGTLELWVGDLEGSRRWVIAREPASVSVALTRWAKDGSAVAYVREGSSVEVVQLDRRHVSIAIPAALQVAGSRISSFERSPGGSRLAATVRPAGGASRESDVFVADARTGASWTQLTTIGDAVAGQWIDETRIFVETGSGMIAVADADTKLLRPLTAMPAASPTVGPDGRVYFTGGEWARGDLSNVPYAAGNVWSVTIDGDDLRRETTSKHDQLRIQGRLADGRFVIASPGSSYLLGEGILPMPWRAGNVRRVVVSGDGRRAIGITDSRIVVLDPTKIDVSVDSGAADAVTVLLDGARSADVWFPSTRVEPVRSSAPPPAPGARLAFHLGRVLWEMGPDGSVRDLVSPGPQGWSGQPAWSPSGDRLAVTTSIATDPPRSTLVVIGRHDRWQAEISAAHDISWSPDGTRIAVVAVSGERSDAPATLIFEASSGRPTERLEGIRAKWTAEGLVAMDQGEMHPDQRIRVGQAVFIVRGPDRIRVTDAFRIASHPRLGEFGDRSLPPLISQLIPSADGRHVGVWLHRARAGGFASGAFAVVRAADGEVLSAITFDPRVGLADVAWSPAAPLLGRTIWGGAGPSAARTASIVDALTGRTLLEREGRFAGWSPDGEAFYVARNEGLFAYPVSGGRPVRVSPLGVQVIAVRR